LPPTKFDFGRFNQLAMPELMPEVAGLAGFWPFPWLPLDRFLMVEGLLRRCEVVVVFIGLIKLLTIYGLFSFDLVLRARFEFGRQPDFARSSCGRLF
jgi:hypothetical protein